MNTEELMNWHDTIFWPKYCHLLEVPYKTQWGPGGKGKSKKRILTLKPSQDLRTKIELAIDAQSLHKRKLYDKLGKEKYEKQTGHLAKTGNGDIYKNRQAVTWINQMGWDDEIPPITEEVKTNKRLCACGNETMPGHHQCQTCYQKVGLIVVK